MTTEDPGFSLYLITDRKTLGPDRDLLSVVEQALQGGVRAVQLREKDLSAADLFDLAVKMRALTRRYGARLLINDRIDVALAAAADGVHLAHHSLPTGIARRLLGPGKMIGVSTHGLDQIPAAAAEGADFVTFSPIYHTPSKSEYGLPQGIDRLKTACRVASLPVLALGGIRREKLAEIRAAGAPGIALISAILADPDPFRATQTLIKDLAQRGFPPQRLSL